jgi:hypothetical protein
MAGAANEMAYQAAYHAAAVAAAAASAREAFYYLELAGKLNWDHNDGSAEQPQWMQQLFALQVSCLKCVQLWQQQGQVNSDRTFSSVWDAVSEVANTCWQQLLTDVCGNRTRLHGCRPSAAEAAAAAPWVALWARCFFAWAGMLEGLCDAIGTPGVEHDKFCPQLLLGYVGRAAVDTGRFAALQDAAGLPASEEQQFAQQLAALKQQLNSVQVTEAAAAAEAAASSQQVASSAASSTEQAAAAAQQLRAFAQAVSGRIPLSGACNNPGCVGLAQRSELLLVGGKSCVCARCKAARWVRHCNKLNPLAKPNSGSRP